MARDLEPPLCLRLPLKIRNTTKDESSSRKQVAQRLERRQGWGGGGARFYYVATGAKGKPPWEGNVLAPQRRMDKVDIGQMESF